jgi:23S rRNA (pseudouridine1915-N3)-methyltransferase
MLVNIVCVGKTEKGYLPEQIESYIKKIKFYNSIQWVELNEDKSSNDISYKKKSDNEVLIAYLKKLDTPIILLDENGKEFTSVEFSTFLQKQQNSSIKQLNFVIGGAFGFTEQVLQLAQTKISLSKMTFSHQMVRLFLAEQLYRAFSILNGSKYHHV